jgi:hypothetical protein
MSKEWRAGQSVFDKFPAQLFLLFLKQQYFQVAQVSRADAGSPS